jgi:toxin ParE1/3/4
MRVKWLRRALQNLTDEADFIAQDSPKSAAEFVAHLLQAAEMLATHPQIGRPGRVPGTRELIVTRFSYILPYRVRDQNVEILRVFHTARKWPQRLP